MAAAPSLTWWFDRASKFHFQAPDLDDLVHWSFIIDGAQFVWPEGK